MTEAITLIEKEFNSSAGASYGIAAITAIDKSCAAILSLSESPLVYWLFVSESLALADDAKSTIQWLERQINQVDQFSPSLAGKLRQGLCNSWLAYLPILLFRADQDREQTWQRYCQTFPGQTQEQQGIRSLLFHLLSEQETFLYDPRTLPPQYREKYTDAASCVIVKLGQLLRRLQKDKTLEQELFETWAEALKLVLHKLPDRVQRGFAPAFPLFENLVLSLLYAAEWRSQPDLWRIAEYIDSCAKYPQERLTPDQVALGAVLFGWLEGYQRVGGGVSEPSLRTALSNQAMAIALQRVPEKPSQLPPGDPIIFYATEQGKQLDLFCQFFQVIQIERRQSKYEQKSLVEADTGQMQTQAWTELEEKIDFRLSRGKFLYHYQYKLVP